MKRHFIIIITIILNNLFFVIYAQHTTKNYEKQLITFIESKQGKNVDWIIIRGLTNNIEYPLINKKLELKNGTYCFFKPSSASIYYIFNFSKGKIDIINNYNVETLLTLYEKEKSKYRNNKDRLTLLEGLIKILAHNENIINNHN